MRRPFQLLLTEIISQLNAKFNAFRLHLVGHPMDAPTADDPADPDARGDHARRPVALVPRALDCDDAYCEQCDEDDLMHGVERGEDRGSTIMLVFM